MRILPLFLICADPCQSPQFEIGGDGRGNAGMGPTMTKRGRPKSAVPSADAIRMAEIRKAKVEKKKSQRRGYNKTRRDRLAGVEVHD